MNTTPAVANDECAPYRQRRLLLVERMKASGGGVALIPTAPEQARNRDTHFPYRADSYFQYLTGFTEPEAVLVMAVGPGAMASQAILFCREKNLEREIWDGFRHGPEGAREVFGFDAAHPVAELDARLSELIADQPALWFSLGHDAGWDQRIAAVLNKVRAESRSGKRAPPAIRDVRAELDAMRLIKDATELATMRRAAEISANAHMRAMRFVAPGRYEYEVEAELLHEFRRHGCEYPAYTPIVAGGANACVLHYVGNDRVLKDGDLLLIDAGGELGGYASDITRCFPVNGRFSGPQADVYDLVLDAQAAAIAALRPGATFADPHDAALKVLAQGMLDMKLLAGSLDAVLESESYKRFYMHRTSHWLGKDVHDAGEYKEGEHWAPLAPGMVLTIEPGCYIRPADDVPEAFWNIGVRIEDDAVVTAAGCEIITAAAPKKIADIEALMRDARGG
ncbi:aminopeptidase P N-terminal domain-containing protein [Sulfuritalea sp.]|uniref:aminopeptidase P N-terminal domain-containing protein n=1 Tax=Sulfuritalea sp. TaxID=2480090 RepID=UPI001AD3FF1F|nr:aminopeptidase P N-terminal domain-containing protein [Sulfuritalea sp.]MBN8475534.1 aminopeptidase P N-terminal domain-containing protein [Sulfuritalea sp.]